MNYKKWLIAAVFTHEGEICVPDSYWNEYDGNWELIRENRNQYGDVRLTVRQINGKRKNKKQQTQPAKCYILLNKGLPINVFSSLEKVEAAAKSNTNYHWASFDVQ